MNKGKNKKRKMKTFGIDNYDSESDLEYIPGELICEKSAIKNKRISRKRHIVIQPKGVDYINRLPYEIILYILELVNSSDVSSTNFYYMCQRVCNLWKQLSCSAQLWSHLNASNFSIVNSTIWSHMTCHHNIRSMSLNNVNLKENQIKDLALHKNLTCISLTDLNIRRKGLWVKVISQLKITELSLYSANKNIDLSYSNMKELFSVINPFLSKLTLSGVKIPPKKLFKFIIKFLPDIEYLALDKLCCFEIDVQDIRHLKKLKSFRFGNCPNILSLKKNIEPIHMPHLEELHLTCCAHNRVASYGFCMLTSAPKLTSLVLCNSYLNQLMMGKTETFFDSMRRIRPPLQNITLYMCLVQHPSSKIFEDFLHDSLSYVSLSHSTIHESILSSIVKDLSSIPNLRELYLNNTHIRHIHVRDLLVNSKLHILDLSNCRNLERGLKKLYSNREMILSLKLKLQDEKYDDNSED